MLPIVLLGAWLVTMFHGKQFDKVNDGGSFSPFHRHRLSILTKTYAAPYDAERRLQGDLAFLSKVLMGCTTYVVGCDCGKIMTVEALGREDRGAVEVKFREVPK
jgi:hypothetical protein